MYIKLPLYLFFYMALGLNDFDSGKSISIEGYSKGWAQMALALLVAISGPKKKKS